MRWVLRVAATAILLAATACSSPPSPPTSEAPTSQAPTSQAPTSQAPMPSPSASGSETAGPGVAASSCLSGTYRLDRLVSVGDNQTYGTGSGGDVTITFTDGTYTLKGAGRKPIRLILAAQGGDLRLDGTVAGTYTGSGSTYDFTVGTSSGRASLEVGGKRQSLSIDEAASVLAPQGTATVACNPPKMVLLLSSTRLELSQR